MTLREIADVLEGFLAHRIVYFGSCSTMRTKRANIDDFLNRTKADILAGYSKDVDFIQATAREMVWMQDYSLFNPVLRTKEDLQNQISPPIIIIPNNIGITIKQ